MLIQYTYIKSGTSVSNRKNLAANFRITFDTDLTFYSFTGEKRIPVPLRQNILEIKFSKDNILEAKKIMYFFRSV